jgi:serine phosphatase RsbU (regulator of sigma subunit)
MLEAPIPADEAERLVDLRRLDLLLSTPEEEFDRVTEELARIFQVPGVMMSFTDRDTQYFKSAVGLPPELAATRTEPRELSVCSHVLGENKMIVVEDLLKDDRFNDNPYVVSSGARFYAGAPLRADSGRAVGTLCLVDIEPRTLSLRERDLLDLIARAVMAQVRLRTASRQLLQRTKQIERELQQAEQMQRFLLPPARLEGDGWRITHLYQPFEHLGGDFLDVHRRADGLLAILVADVSGHGTSAALTTAMAKTAFHRAAPNVDGPAPLLTILHHELTGFVPPGHFMSAMAAFFDPSGRSITIASAGHPPPLLIRDGAVEVIRHDNEMLLLVGDNTSVYQNQTVRTLSPGDRILGYTDGATEAVDPRGNRLDVDGLCRQVEEVAGEPAPVLLAALMSRLRHHARNRFQDDVALLCIEACES